MIELLPPRALVRLTFDAPDDVSPNPDVRIDASTPLRAFRRAASSMPADWLAASEMRGAADVGCGAAGAEESDPPKRFPKNDIQITTCEDCTSDHRSEFGLPA